MSEAFVYWCQKYNIVEKVLKKWSVLFIVWLILVMQVKYKRKEKHEYHTLLYIFIWQTQLSA